MTQSSTYDATAAALEERENALIGRWGATGLKGEGPLTQAQVALEAAYEAHCEAQELEHDPAHCDCADCDRALLRAADRSA